MIGCQRVCRCLSFYVLNDVGNLKFCLALIINSFSFNVKRWTTLKPFKKWWPPNLKLPGNLSIMTQNGRCWVQFFTVFISLRILSLADFLLLKHPFTQIKFYIQLPKFIRVLSKMTEYSSLWMMTPVSSFIINGVILTSLQLLKIVKVLAAFTSLC